MRPANRETGKQRHIPSVAFSGKPGFSSKQTMTAVFTDCPVKVQNES